MTEWCQLETEMVTVLNAHQERKVCALELLARDQILPIVHLDCGEINTFDNSINLKYSINDISDKVVEIDEPITSDGNLTNSKFN
jgi:hypothetical protein